MYRNIKVLIISAINGVCLFMLCARICRLGKTEFLSPSHSLSIALVIKIFCNLISDRGRIAIDFLWNTSVLIIYAIFTYAVDHHEVIKRYKTIYPTPSFFRNNTPIITHTEYPWTDYRFIVTTILLVLVLYSPFVFKAGKPTQPVDDELINRYKRLLELKKHKKSSRQRSDLMSSTKESIKEEIIKSIKEKTASPRTSQSQCKQNLKDADVDGRDSKSQMILNTLPSTTTTKFAYHKPDEKSVGDMDRIENIDLNTLAHRRNGTGDRTFESSINPLIDLCTINTQTDLKMTSPSRSTAIQCTKLTIPWKIAKSVISRKTGSSMTYMVSRTDKSTNTIQVKYRTKTKSTSLQHSLNSKSKSKSKSKSTAKDSFKLVQYTMHVRKHPRKEMNQPPNVATNYHNLGHDPVRTAQHPDCFSLQRSQSQVFNLDDLMHARYDSPLHDGVISLDMFPTKDYSQKHKDPLEMLYNDPNNSNYDEQFTRYDYYKERRRY